MSSWCKESIKQNRRDKRLRTKWLLSSMPQLLVDFGQIVRVKLHLTKLKFLLQMMQMSQRSALLNRNYCIWSSLLTLLHNHSLHNVSTKSDECKEQPCSVKEQSCNIEVDMSSMNFIWVWKSMLLFQIFYSLFRNRAVWNSFFLTIYYKVI